MPKPMSTDWIMKLAVGVVVGALAIVIGGAILGIVFIDRSSGDSADQTPVVADETSVEVEIADFTFIPAELTVGAGAEITWRNSDPVIHDATAREDSWATDVIAGGESQTLVFDTPGTFEYYCTIHPWMEGTIIVR